jgi:hypothetical protein
MYAVAVLSAVSGIQVAAPDLHDRKQFHYGPLKSPTRTEFWRGVYLRLLSATLMFLN